MTKKAVTRNDVAKAAGVSPAVVSYVLNNSKFVSGEKRKAVLDAVEKLNYSPNMMARGLKTNQSMQIAFVCDNLRNDWLQYAEEMLFEEGYYVSHCYSRDDESFVRMIINRRFDAVFMMSNRYSTEQLNLIASNGIPIALYKTRHYDELAPNIVVVVPDYAEGVTKCANYLIHRGHKKIVFIPPVRYQTIGLGSDDFRMKAYEKTMSSHGLELRPEFILTNTESEETFRRAIFQLLVESTPEERPTAFLVCNDHLAVDVMLYVQSLGFRVPEDVAITGADNAFIGSVVTPALTTVDFDKKEFARQLSATLLGLINGEKPEDAYLDVSVVIRQSV